MDSNKLITMIQAVGTVQRNLWTVTNYLLNTGIIEIQWTGTPYKTRTSKYTEQFLEGLIVFSTHSTAFAPRILQEIRVKE